MAETDAVVVGAGPNGLAAAVALAREGMRVTVHEGADRIGGGTRTEELTLPDFLHDVCSAVHPMGAGSPFFRQLPLEEHGLEWIHPPVLMAHPFDDGTAAVLMRSTEDTADSLGTDGAAYRRLIEPFVRHWQPLMDEALAPPLHIPKRPWLLARLGLFGLRSATGLSGRVFTGERARAWFTGLAGHTLLPMDRRPGAGFGLLLAVAGHGVGWPLSRGGSRSITDALASLLHDHGGRVITGSPVRTVDALPQGQPILLDLTARQVLEVAGHRFPRRYHRHLARFRYGPGAFKVDWALSEPIPWTAGECRQAGTLHLGGSAGEIARSAEAAWHGQHDDEPFVLMAQPSLFDPSRAPAGKHTAWGYCHVPHGSTRDMTEAVERQVERFAPGFRDTILARSVMNTRQLEAHNPNLVGGDFAGGLQDVKQFLFRPAPRLDPYSTPGTGIYICSASTPPGGAVHGMCGYHAARSVLKRGG